MDDFVPVACPDGGEAGSVWRAEKLKDFAWRARCLGLDGDPDIAALLSQIQADTEVVESIWQQQSQPEYEQPWWQDGEYDDQRAAQANDHALEVFSTGNHSDAFDAFTEAIRLCPKSAVYHCNRAAAALKLGRADIAAEDAAHALARDGNYARAHLRAGKARLALHQPQQAVEHFTWCIQHSPKAAAAQGLKEAETMLNQHRLQQQQEEAAAAAASRPALPRHAVLEEHAVQQLLTAEGMVAAHPQLEAAKAARVEALIVCGRYGDALAACGALLESVERLYLEGEALWRGGNVAGAAVKLEAACARCPDSAKCSDTLAFVLDMQQRIAAADGRYEDGQYRECMEECTAALENVDSAACVGLVCNVLRRRALAAAARRLFEEALKDLNMALQYDPGNADCLRARADVTRSMGRYTDSFLDLQRLSKVAPGTPDLGDLMESIARLCLNHSEEGGAAQGQFEATVGGSASALSVLGLETTATAGQVRQAYLKLAAQWHPDKWSSGSTEDQQVAEEKFKHIQAAYDTLVPG